MTNFWYNINCKLQWWVVNPTDGYIAYPIGIVGTVVGQGETYEEALSDVKSALACYLEIFGQEILEDISPVEVFIAEAGVTV